MAAAGVTVAQVVGLLGAVSEFLAGPRTAPRAAQALQGGLGSVIGQVNFAANVAFGLALVLTAVSAMRAGLLSRFMGILGVAVGVLFGLGGLGQAFLLFFWAGAVALILLDRWPGGRGPAWASGELVPWPTGAEIRAARAREAEGDGDNEPEEPPPPRKRKRRG